MTLPQKGRDEAEIEGGVRLVLGALYVKTDSYGGVPCVAPRISWPYSEKEIAALIRVAITRSRPNSLRRALSRSKHSPPKPSSSKKARKK